MSILNNLKILQNKLQNTRSKMNLCVKSKFFKPSFIGTFCRFATTPPEGIEQNEQAVIDDSDEALAKEAEIEALRNISRLSLGHFNLVNNRRPYEEPRSLAHLTVKYHRKMYGKYGSASGVNPSLCWPSKQDIKDKLDFESVAFPFTIRQMMDAVSEKNVVAAQKIEARERDLAAKFAKLDQWKKDLNEKVTKKTAEADAAKQRKERLVEEVRRHFGFTLDPRDERFQEMLAKREKEQKKQEKLARKEAKEKMMIAKLQQQNMKIGDADKS